MNASSRKYITSLVAFSFLVVGGTGLYFKFFSKNHSLEEIHTWVGIIMVLAAFFHVFQNWKPMTNHLKNIKVYSLLIPILAIVIGFSLEAQKEGKGMNPKEISKKILEAKINNVAPIFHKTSDEMINSMKSDGLNVSNGEQSLIEVAKTNHQEPPKMFKYLN